MPAPRLPEPHLPEEAINEKLRTTKSKSEYRRWLAVSLSLKRQFPHREIADILGVSVQAVDLWLGAYNREGPKALQSNVENRGRKPFLESAKEIELLDDFKDRAKKGELVTAEKIRSKICEILGHKVSTGYPYRMLERNNWRKIKPRPTHPKSDKKAQEDLKKTSQPMSWKPPKSSTKITKGRSE